MTDRRPLFLLAVDHRRSFERLFGIDAPVGSADRARLEAAKGLVAEALGDVAAERDGTAGGGLGILIDDVYGAVAIATARRTGVAVALAFERSARRKCSGSNTPTGEIGSPPTRRTSSRC